VRLRSWSFPDIAKPLAIAAVSAIVLVAASAALAGSSANGCPCWTPADVLKATGTHQVVPVYAVPKQHKKYTLAFIHLDETTPTFATWVVAMKAAAKFYGVNILQTQEAPNGDEVLPQLYAQLRVNHPAVVGAQHATQALLNATKADNVPLFGLDSTVIPGIYHMGVPDKQAGRFAADALGPVVKKAMSTTWKGKQLYYLGLDYVPCQPCQDRVDAGFTQIQKYVKIPASHELLVTTAQNPDQIESQVANILTAHPNAVFASLSLNDEWGIGGFQAAKAAGRQKDMLGVTLGCDSAGIGALKDKSNAAMDIGCVNFNAYAEGWNWVEAAIAIAIGKDNGTPIHFKNFSVTQYVPRAKVNAIFPNG
jgi:ABC-type sugar transport system substrate-binding protein